MERYPQKRSAAMPALWAVQRRYGWCTPEGIDQAAAVMGVTPGYLESVASFYDLFRLEPEGEHQVLVCTNISCWLRGADRLLEAFSEAAGIDGRRSEDGKLFVRGFECMGACDLAPMASIDERYYGPLTEDDARPRRPSSCAPAAEVLPDKRLRTRPRSSPGAADAKGGRGLMRLQARRPACSSATSTSRGWPRSTPTASSAATGRSRRPTRR